MWSNSRTHSFRAKPKPPASEQKLSSVSANNCLKYFRSSFLHQIIKSTRYYKMASRVLDEFIIQEVARTCPESFIAFHKCMDDPAIRDKANCDKHQLDLQACIKNEVTVYHKIEKNCSNAILKYQDCLMKDTEGNSSSKCYEPLKDLRSCAMNVIDSAQRDSKK